MITYYRINPWYLPSPRDCSSQKGRWALRCSRSRPNAQQQTWLKAGNQSRREGGWAARAVMWRDEDAGMRGLEEPYTFCHLGVTVFCQTQNRSSAGQSQRESSFFLPLRSLGVAVHGRGLHRVPRVVFLGLLSLA